MSKELKLRNQYIYELARNGEPQVNIARDFELSRERISKIVKKLKAREAKLIRNENEKV